MSRLRSIRAFGAGVLLGVIVGSAAVAGAAFGYKAWTSVHDDYKIGYVAGFFSMANLARNLQPGGWVDSRYPHLPQVKAPVWRAKLDELYAKPENQKYSVNGLLQVAARELEKQYGKAIDPIERARQNMKEKLRAIAARKQREQQQAGATAGKPEGSVAQETEAGDEATDVELPVEPSEKVDAPAKKPAAVEAPVERKKKWCRCDGTDPQAARAERQAKAKAEEEAEEMAAKSSAKTPPNAPAKP